MLSTNLLWRTHTDTSYALWMLEYSRWWSGIPHKSECPEIHLKISLIKYKKQCRDWLWSTTPGNSSMFSAYTLFNLFIWSGRMRFEPKNTSGRGRFVLNHDNLNQTEYKRGKLNVRKKEAMCRGKPAPKQENTLLLTRPKLKRTKML